MGTSMAFTRRQRALRQRVIDTTIAAISQRVAKLDEQITSVTNALDTCNVEKLADAVEAGWEVVKSSKKLQADFEKNCVRFPEVIAIQEDVSNTSVRASVLTADLLDAHDKIDDHVNDIEND